MKPNREHIKLWVDALRSGKYKQGRASLKYSVGFCCMGVACDISSLGEWQVRLSSEEEIYLGSGCYLPYDVQMWLGLREENPRIKSVSNSGTLAFLNDSAKLTFPQIADLIEAEYLK